MGDYSGTTANDRPPPTIYKFVTRTTAKDRLPPTNCEYANGNTTNDRLPKRSPIPENYPLENPTGRSSTDKDYNRPTLGKKPENALAGPTYIRVMRETKARGTSMAFIRGIVRILKFHVVPKLECIGFAHSALSLHASTESWPFENACMHAQPLNFMYIRRGAKRIERQLTVSPKKSPSNGQVSYQKNPENLNRSLRPLHPYLRLPLDMAHLKSDQRTTTTTNPTANSTDRYHYSYLATDAESGPKMVLPGMSAIFYFTIERFLNGNQTDSCDHINNHYCTYQLLRKNTLAGLVNKETEARHAGGLPIRGSSWIHLKMWQHLRPAPMDACKFSMLLIRGFLLLSEFCLLNHSKVLALSCPGQRQQVDHPSNCQVKKHHNLMTPKTTAKSSTTTPTKSNYGKTTTTTKGHDLLTRLSWCNYNKWNGLASTVPTTTQCVDNYWPNINFGGRGLLIGVNLRPQCKCANSGSATHTLLPTPVLGCVNSGPRSVFNVGSGATRRAPKARGKQTASDEGARRGGDHKDDYVRNILNVQCIIMWMSTMVSRRAQYNTKMRKEKGQCATTGPGPYVHNNHSSSSHSHRGRNNVTSNMSHIMKLSSDISNGHDIHNFLGPCYYSTSLSHPGLPASISTSLLCGTTTLSNYSPSPPHPGKREDHRKLENEYQHDHVDQLCTGRLWKLVDPNTHLGPWTNVAGSNPHRTIVRCGNLVNASLIFRTLVKLVTKLFSMEHRDVQEVLHSQGIGPNPGPNPMTREQLRKMCLNDAKPAPTYRPPETTSRTELASHGVPNYIPPNLPRPVSISTGPTQVRDKAKSKTKAAPKPSLAQLLGTDSRSGGTSTIKSRSAPGNGEPHAQAAATSTSRSKVGSLINFYNGGAKSYPSDAIQEEHVSSPTGNESNNRLDTYYKWLHGDGDIELVRQMVNGQNSDKHTATTNTTNYKIDTDSFVACIPVLLMVQRLPLLLVLLCWVQSCCPVPWSVCSV